MMLSILICSLTERWNSASRLIRELSEKATPSVEILSISDNRRRSTGNKRQHLLDMAQGKYVTFVDDDDGVSDNYFEKILGGINSDADLISFNSLSRINDGNTFVVRSRLGNPIDQVRMVNGVWQDIQRPPWHWCAWKAEIAHRGTFPDAWIDDDWFWLRQIIPHVKTEFKIDECLHLYSYNSKTSASNQGDSVTNGTMI